MKALSNRVTWGLLLIGFGVLVLLQNLDLLPDSSLLWAVAFGAAGLVFFIYFLSAPDRWWASFPAFGFLGITGTIVITDLLPRNTPDEWAGAFFMGMLGLSFLAIYLRTREHWWPVIPGGSLLTITGIIVVAGVYQESDASLITLTLFGGLALTFLLLLILPSKSGRARWAIWPAVGLLIAAFLASASAFNLLNLILPAGLIIGGLFILLRGMR
jgi:hypothetical protein